MHPSADDALEPVTCAWIYQPQNAPNSKAATHAFVSCASSAWSPGLSSGCWSQALRLQLAGQQRCPGCPQTAVVSQDVAASTSHAALAEPQDGAAAAHNPALKLGMRIHNASVQARSRLKVAKQMWTLLTSPRPNKFELCLRCFIIICRQLEPVGWSKSKRLW